MRDVSFTVEPGPFGLGLIGESGSGKTTIARAVLRLVPDGGRHDRLRRAPAWHPLRGRDLRAYRRAVQIVLQDGSEALDPRMRIGASIAEALAVHDVVPRAGRAGRVADLLAEVGLEPTSTRGAGRTSSPAASGSG